MRRKSCAGMGLAFGMALAAAVPARAIITSEIFDTPPQQYTYINAQIGATTFYNNGFTGASAVIANIEAGFIWDGQESLTQDTIEFGSPQAAGQVDQHATWVGSILNGNAPATYAVGSAAYYGYMGIAPGATVWSGDVATQWTDAGADDYSTGFVSTTATVQTAYDEAIVSGVPEANYATADVINSSWGNSGGDDDGSSLDQLILDGLIAQSGQLGAAKTVVVAAGNSGPGDNSMDTFPASSGNVITVGALQSSGTPPTYPSIASFSSRSPSDFFDPVTNTEIPDARALVDLVAPGTDLVAAEYDGQTGGNAFGGGVPDPSASQVAYGLGGTSFASPIVAGGAALVVDAGKQEFPSDPNAIDGRVVKAVLMNSATKPAGWNNGQQNVNGVITTSQALDYTYGAGEINLTQAYNQYLGGTTDVASPGNFGSVNVQNLGWAFGAISHEPGETVTEDYRIAEPVNAGDTMAATLVWFDDEMDADSPGSGYGSLDDLDLSIYLTSGVSQPELIAESDAMYDSLQHLYFTLPVTGTYEMEISETNYVYNFVGDTTTDFGLAWSAVPEPTAMTLLAFASFMILARRKRPGNFSLAPAAGGKGE
ncbi:MAG TPA: S8 family serine peptidase [Tepidisphaeraceae bacterium]|nr:S8 family serine peptidase [Tepidisphaeraceae bacterium]